MLFNSYIFILIFMPLCLIGYFGLNRLNRTKAAMIYLLGISLWFYGYFHPKYLIIITASIVTNYLLYQIMLRADGKLLRKTTVICGIAANIALLMYFKYTDFFLSTVNSVAGTDFSLLHLTLPLGISFFTFQQISFLVDTYREEVPAYDFVEYACFVTYFPQLIAGPIVTHDELIPQFQDETKKQLTWENFSKGMYLFALGLGKKVLVADTFGRAADIGFSDVGALDSTNAVITMLSYTFQLYFDFSGYCDMANGLGKMMNIDLPLNFNSPYKALTIVDFWKRWHLTLTRFFTKYIYIPLGGSWYGERRTYLNTFLVFLISGFWHGAGFNFIIWGIGHGVFFILTKKFHNRFSSLHPALNWIITFGFVNIMWVFFRASSVSDALVLLNRIAAFDFGPVFGSIVSCFDLPEITMFLDLFPVRIHYPNVLLTGAFLLALFCVLGTDNAFEKMKRFRPSAGRCLIIVILLIWCIASFRGVSTFLYFNF